MLALCLMLSKTYYAQNYAGIIGLGLSYEKEKLKHQKEQALLASIKALLPSTDVDVPPENEP